MTAQVKERIYVEGVRYGMSSEPLAPYLRNMKSRPVFTLQNTACWRGYLGTWEIKNKKLYLIDFTALIYNPSEDVDHERGMEYLFPNQEKVLADWFSGELQIPQGRLLDFQPGTYLSKYEYDLFLSFENGVITQERLVDNIATNTQNNLAVERKGILQRLAGVFTN